MSLPVPVPELNYLAPTLPHIVVLHIALKIAEFGRIQAAGMFDTPAVNIEEPDMLSAGTEGFDTAANYIAAPIADRLFAAGLAVAEQMSVLVA